MIEYQFEPSLSMDEFIDVLKRSSLAKRRPVDDLKTMEGMLQHADLILTARSEGRLVGVGRAITDHSYCTYLSDLAVDEGFQRKGIGRELLDRIHSAAGKHTTLILLAAPQAEGYYPHIGMQPHPSCWITPSQGTAGTSTNHPSPTVGASSSETLQSIDNAPTEGEWLPSADSATPNNVDRFFDSIADGYDAAILRCFPRYYEMLQTLIEYLPYQSAQPLRILDLGAGTGNLTRLIQTKFTRAKITAVDISDASLETCRKRCGNAVETIVCDMRSVDFRNEQFDLIVSSIAIHHLTDQEKRELFDKAASWLSPGGTISFADQFAGETQDLYDRHISGWKNMSRGSVTSAGEPGAEEAWRSEWEMWMRHQAEHDYHQPVGIQMQMLRDAQFHSVDCIWRCLLWSVLQARKP